MAKFNAKRQKVYMRDELDWQSELDGVYLSDVIAKLTELQKKHGDEALFGMSYESDYGYNSGYTSIDVHVTSERLETDEEFDKRHKEWQAIEKHKRQEAKERRAKRETFEREMYAKLSKKYGKK